MSSTYSNGLAKAPSDREAFIEFSKRLLNLEADIIIVDLDKSFAQEPPLADLGIWLDSWHNLVDALGTREDAKEGIELARDILYFASCRMKNMLFSVDYTKPPLDQFMSGIKKMFQASTCYTLVEPVALYKSRVVYWGSNPSDILTTSVDWMEIRTRRYHLQY
jgi:hypothetical protein